MTEMKITTASGQPKGSTIVTGSNGIASPPESTTYEIAVAPSDIEMMVERL